nr:hypothetical protein [Halovivax sp. KZCA124]
MLEQDLRIWLEQYGDATSSGNRRCIPRVQEVPADEEFEIPENATDIEVEYYANRPFDEEGKSWERQDMVRVKYLEPAGDTGGGD